MVKGPLKNCAIEVKPDYTFIVANFSGDPNKRKAELESMFLSGTKRLSIAKPKSKRLLKKLGLDLNEPIAKEILCTRVKRARDLSRSEIIVANINRLIFLHLDEHYVNIDIRLHKPINKEYFILFERIKYPVNINASVPFPEAIEHLKKKGFEIYHVNDFDAVEGETSCFMSIMLI